MQNIKVFQKPSEIEFVVQEPSGDAKPCLKDAGRGNTFLRDGAVCMRVDVSAYQAIRDMPKEISDRFNAALYKKIFIINLQTGRVFVADGKDEIQWIKVKMTLEGDA